MFEELKADKLPKILENKCILNLYLTGFCKLKDNKI